LSDQPDAAAPADVSESENIRQALIRHIEAGADFTDSAARQRAGHEVEKELNVPYGNVCKQFGKAWKIAKSKKGLTDSATKNIGSAKVTFRKPEDKQPEEQPPASGTTQAGQPPEQAAQQQAVPAGQQVTDYRSVFEKCNSIEDFRKTTEYQFLRLNYEMMFKEGAFKIYDMFGIPVSPDLMQAEKGKESKIDMLCDAWAIMHAKNNWQFPGWVEKALLFGGTAAVLLLPPLAHFGIIDDIKNMGKKKDKDAKASDAPLASTETKV